MLWLPTQSPLLQLFCVYFTTVIGNKKAAVMLWTSGEIAEKYLGGEGFPSSPKHFSMTVNAADQ
jgi:hypothetical protein